MAPILKDNNLQLRLASIKDVEARFALGNHAEIKEMFGISRNEVRPITKDGVTQWVQWLIGHPHAWVIEAHGELIGEIRLDNVDLRDRRASMAIGIFDPQALGQGLGTAAILLLLQHAFVDLRLHRIGVRVLAYNKRAIRAYEKCGFIVEGRERETAFVNGVWHDDLMMGILEHEFLSRRN